MLTLAGVIEADFMALTNPKDEDIDPDILRVDSDTFRSGDGFVVASLSSSFRSHLSMKKPELFVVVRDAFVRCLSTS